MKTLHYYALALAVVFLMASAAVSPAISDIIGSWVFNVEQTMPEYSKGKIIFEEGDEVNYSGRIVFESGRVITISSVDVKSDTVTFKAYVDGGLVTTVCTIEGDELVGSVRTPDGMLPFQATREK